jgi:phage N-6-adenine-methyltransferase
MEPCLPEQVLGVGFMDSTEPRSYHPRPKRIDWQTPRWLWDALDKEFSFSIDAAASPENTMMGRFWTEADDALSQSWSGERVWINPPFTFAILRQFVRKAWHESRKLNTIAVVLVPLKTDQDWWHEYAIRTEIRFIRGRITFDGAAGQYPGPLALLVFGTAYLPRMVSLEK